MPAPKFLAGLPKPLLFGLYGAVGGLLGALVFAEPLWQLVSPPPPPPVPPPEPRVAVAASKDVEVFVDGRNTFPVQIARADFDGPVTVKFENLPGGVSIAPVTIAAGKTEGEATVTASRSATSATKTVKVVAEAHSDGKTATAETSISCQVSDPARPQADIIFVLDVTGSMGWAIDGVRDGIGRFANDLNRNKIDFRAGLVAFRDLTYPQDERSGLKLMEVLQFKGEPFTSDPETFRDEVRKRLQASGGGDDPESSLEAIGEAIRQPMRKGATKVLLLITDVPPKVTQGQNTPQQRSEELAAAKRTAESVKQKEIDAVHLVVNQRDLDVYRPLMEAGLLKDGGKYFDLQSVARGSAGFDSLLNDFSRVVTEAAKAKNPEGKLQVAGKAEQPTLGVKGVQSSREFAKGTEGQLLLAIGVWTGAIAGLVCLVLLAGQHHYLRGSPPALGGAAAGLVGGLAVGLVGGAAGQGLFMLAPESPTLAAVFRVVGWAILGGLAGAGLSLFIPNLKWVHGLAGGALGGAVGAGGYLAVTSLAGDFVGRLVGGLLLGLCIGLMVAVVEAAFRRAWLEVRYGARETITVNLGPEPVKVGGDARACTVWARGAAPLALRFFVRDGQVICEDTPTRTEAVVGNGDTREVGNVTVTVRTGTSAAPATPTPPRPSAPAALPRPSAPAPPPATPKPLDLPPLDLDPLPAPAPAAAPARPPVPTAGSKPPVPAPAAAPRPASAPAPATKPAVGPRDPDACPTCGRKTPGRPGARYCMVCDQTY
jgi:Mg-chelatase subunit ChlD